MVYKSIIDVVLDMWIIKDFYFLWVFRFFYFEFFCDNINIFYWDGCENDRY